MNCNRLETSDDYERKFKEEMKMGKLAKFLERYPHWIFYIAAGIGLFATVFNYQHGHVEELPFDLGITFVAGIMVITIEKTWLRHQREQETTKERKERLKETLFTMILSLVGTIIGIIIYGVELISGNYQGKTIDIANIDVIVALGIVVVILLVRCICLKRKLKK